VDGKIFFNKVTTSSNKKIYIKIF